MMNKAAASSGGVGVCGALGVTLIVLKLCGVLQLAWLWVLAPFWIPPMIVAAALAAVLAGIAVRTVTRRYVFGRTDTAKPPIPPLVQEPVQGWTKPRLTDFLTRNLGFYGLAQEAKLRKTR